MAVRRRRTRRHRRNRKIRRAVLILFCASLTVGLSSVALRYLTPSLFREARVVEPLRPSAEASENALRVAQQESFHQYDGRTVYPYSVVPGGVRDVHELKWAVDHDPVVAAHYAGFDFQHAQLVRLLFTHSVYVSYRIGNRVYWTRHRVALRKGETLLTDGKMTARTRCANRVEETPQQQTSNAEPPAAKFEEPQQPASGTAINNPPVPYESSLMNRPGVPDLGPAPPLTLYDPMSSGTGIPIAPPPIPNVCGPEKNKNGSTGGPTLEVSGSGKKKKIGPCGETGGEVPEPGTWLLVASGLAGLYWLSRHKLAHA